MICECNINPNLNISYEEEKEEEKEEIDESYLDYFLSLINYKIVICYNLFFKFSSFYYNAGFYISFPTLLVCFIFMSLFWISAIPQIKIIFFKNIPTKVKLKGLFKKQMEKKAENQFNKSNRNNNKKATENPILYNKNSFPPKKKE